jgi:hypothetical protein
MSPERVCCIFARAGTISRDDCLPCAETNTNIAKHSLNGFRFMNHCHHITALAPTARMRRDWLACTGAPALCDTIAAVGMSSLWRGAAQYGVVGKSMFINRRNRGFNRGTDV